MTTLALTYEDAAAACGYSVKVLRQHVKDGNLIPSFGNSKPVFRVSELERWLETLPAERPGS